jgi:hypothetical protein
MKATPDEAERATPPFRKKNLAKRQSRKEAARQNARHERHGKHHEKGRRHNGRSGRRGRRR